MISLLAARTLPGLYLQIQLLLAVSYVAFSAGRAVATRLAPGLLENPRATLRAAQALVVAALVAPAALALVPARHLPVPTALVAHGPLSEGVLRAYARSRHRMTVPRPHPDAPPMAKSSESEADWPETAAAAALALGAALLALRLARGLRQLRRLSRGAIALRTLGRVRLLVSDEVAVPFSVLLGRAACVVIPARLLGRPRDLRLAVRHELQHHRSRDTAWALFMELALCALYPNPAFHLWRKRIVELQEYSCDGALLGRRGVSPRDYGSCLVRVAEAALGQRPMTVGTAGMATGSGNPEHVKSFLMRRIEMFAHHQSGRSRERTRKTRRIAAVLGTLSLALTLTVAYGAHQSLRAAEKLGPNPGSPTLDPVIERIAEDVLTRAVSSMKARAGFVVVADPLTGRLLAAANAGQPGEVPREGHWELSYLLEPASAMKGLAAASAIEAGVTTENETHDCERGEYRLGGQVYHDWKAGGFDKLTTAETVVKSSNICGIKIGERLGAAGLTRMLHSFGFGPGGVTTGFPGAMAGQFPETGQLPDDQLIPLVSTGYTNVAGFYVTPLEMVQAYGAIANGGRLLRPQDSTETATEVLGRPISEDTARTMRRILRRVVVAGTGTNAVSRLYTTAGKTSSAYHPGDPEHDLLGGENAIAGFVGFAPAENPRVAIYAGIIDPDGGLPSGRAHGNTHAAPVFRDVAEKVLLYLGVAPDR